MALLTTPVSTPVDAHPDHANNSSAAQNETDAHGLNAGTYATLWSGDQDAAVLRNDSTERPLSALAQSTDVPFDRPPEATERWNRADHRDFPETNASVSVHPEGATLRDGVIVRDAYVETFAVQPATRTRLSPSAERHYVAPDGELLATVDYRLAVGEGLTSSNYTHRIEEVRLLVDDEVEATVAGTHTPVLEFGSLDAYPGSAHTLTVEADIVVGGATCDSTASNCTSSGPTIERVTVRDSVAVVVYDPGLAMNRTRYPNGDLGHAVYTTQPWLGYSVGESEVRGAWRFYSARNETWDTLVVRSADETTTTHSPLHPLEVTAYPIASGPRSHGRTEILDTYGVEYDPPTLPSEVRLDTPYEPYIASFGIATRTSTEPGGDESIVVHGLVRGAELSVPTPSTRDVSHNRSQVTLEIVDRSAETVTVRARLEDENTSEPIDTSRREGSLVLAGERVETGADGTVTRTVPRESAVTVRYEPGRWWIAQTAYVGESDVIHVRGTLIPVVETLYRAGIPISLFLLGVFLIDRITGWRVWPPWRGL